MGGRSSTSTSSNKQITKKVGNFKFLKRKRLIKQQQVGNIAKQLFQTVQWIEAKPQPAHPFSIISFPSFFLKTANHIVKHCCAFYPLFSLLQTASFFFPINAPWKSSLYFRTKSVSSDVQEFWQRQSFYFGKFFRRKNKKRNK